MTTFCQCRNNSTTTKTKKKTQSGNGGDKHSCLHPQLITSWLGVNEGRKRREGWGGKEMDVEGGVSVEGITLPNPLWRPRLGALSVAAGANTQRGCRSPWGDSQAPASLPLSSVRLSASPSSNLPGGNLLPASTFFLPPLPPGGAGEVVLKGTPRQGQGSIGVGA